MGHRVRVAVNALTAEEVLKGTFGRGAAIQYKGPSPSLPDADLRGICDGERRDWARAVFGLRRAVDGCSFRQVVEWKFDSLEKVAAFLDFASGYGRFTRFLVQHLPADRIWVSDIQADAVAFQEEQFGVHGFVGDEPGGSEMRREVRLHICCLAVQPLARKDVRAVVAETVRYVEA